MSLFYGQIRPGNFAVLLDLFGCEPPWPMERAPHVDLVQALQEGRDPWGTSFAAYLCRTGRPGLLEERCRVLCSLMATTGPLPVDVCCDSVLDGNHRTAVCLVQGRTIQRVEHLPYQTISTPARRVDGRRLDDRWPLDYDFRGKTVLDLGARDGMNAVRALEAGAARVVLVDHDFTSLTWQVLDDYEARSRCEVLVVDARELAPVDCDVVLALSVVAHIGAECLTRLARGGDCILETHAEDQSPPDTGHRWRMLKAVSYSRAEPDRTRRIFVGER